MFNSLFKVTVSAHQACWSCSSIAFHFVIMVYVRFYKQIKCRW